MGLARCSLAKRFTDTDKWKRPWFTQLAVKAKLAWIYILDNCDHRGVWFADFRLMSFQLDFKVARSEFEEWFGDKVLSLGDRYFIPSFIPFQYVELKHDNRAHKQVLSLLVELGIDPNDLTKEGPSKGLQSPIDGCKDKDKEQVKDKEQQGGAGGIAPPDFDAVYDEYPRKEGKDGGRKIFQKLSPQDRALVPVAIANYKAKKAGKDPEFLLHFKTFMGQWRDWLDIQTGTVVAPIASAKLSADEEYERYRVEGMRQAEDEARKAGIL